MTSRPETGGGLGLWRASLMLIGCLLVRPGGALAAEAFDHSAWDALLAEQVVALGSEAVTAVDYAGMADDSERLRRYLASTTAVTREQFDAWDKNTQLAFLINVYNARTVELILTGWPDLESIKDLGSFFRSPWKKRFFKLLGEERSLDEVEHGLIRASGRYEEPRIHFAVNCASKGCPALRREAYEGARLDAQLEDATRSFLGDRSRNRLEGDTLKVSSIFKWYRGDFELDWRGAETLGEFLALYAGSLGLDDDQRRRLRNGELEIDFLDYDWSLNGLPAGLD